MTSSLIWFTLLQQKQSCGLVSQVHIMRGRHRYLCSCPHQLPVSSNLADFDLPSPHFLLSPIYLFMNSNYSAVSLNILFYNEYRMNISGFISSPNAMLNTDLEFKIIKIRYTSRKLQTLSVASIPAPIPCSCRVPIMAPVHTSTSRKLYQTSNYIKQQ